MKYLGIIIDRKLKWKNYIDYTQCNIARKIGFMYRSCKYVSKRHKLTIYRSIIEPYFVYSPTILFALNNAQIRRLQIQQNKIIRFILNKEYDTPVAEMMGSMGWLNVKQLITYHTLKFISQLRLGQLSSYLYEGIQYNFEVHDCNTRNRNNMRLSRMKTDLQKKSVFFKGFKLFIQLPAELKECHSGEIFKRLLKMHCKTLFILN